MMTNDLLKTLEKLRSSKYPDLDKQVIKDIVSAQADFMANPSEAYNRISQAVEACLKRQEGL